MDTDQLRIFVEVARAGSFTAVARDRATDPSSISRAIGQLEASLGVRLIQRTTRRMTLTEAGTLYRQRVETVLGELDQAGEAARSAGAHLSGTVRLAASLAYGQARLVPLLPELRTVFPRLRLVLVLRDEPTDMLTDRLDLAIRLGPRVDGDAVAAKLQPVRHKVVASLGWTTREERPETPAALAERRCLLADMPDFRHRWRFRDWQEIETEIAVDGDLVLQNPLALREAALMGLGPALLPTWLVAEDIEAGRLVDLFPDHTVAQAAFESAAWLLYPARSWLPARVRAVADFLKARL